MSEPTPIETDEVRTPPAQQGPLKQTESSPPSRGASSNASGQMGTKDEIRPGAFHRPRMDAFLQETISQNVVTLSLPEFTQHCLHITPPPEPPKESSIDIDGSDYQKSKEKYDQFVADIDQIRQSCNIKPMFETLSSDFKTERNMYAPFCAFANHVINLAEDLGMAPDGAKPRFIRNDPRHLDGSRSERLPDVVVVHADSIQFTDSAFYLGKSKEEQKYAKEHQLHISDNFRWIEPYSTVEFKWTPVLAARLAKVSAESAARRQRPTIHSSTTNTIPSDAGPSSNSGLFPTTPGGSHLLVGASNDGKKRKTADEVEVVNEPKKKAKKGKGKRKEKREVEEGEEEEEKEGEVEGFPAKAEKEPAYPPKGSLPSRDDVKIQAANSALEMFTYGGLCSHVISLTVDTHLLGFWFYDRACAVQCTLFDYRAQKNLDDFIKILVGFARLRRSEWGFVDGFENVPFSLPSVPRRPSSVATPASAPPTAAADDGDAAHTPESRNTMWEFAYKGGTYAFTDTMGRIFELKLGETLYTQHTLVGRGTLVVKATVLAVTNAPDDPSDYTDMIGKEYVLKFSWAAESRTGEATFIDKARGMAVGKDEYMKDHLPDVVAWAVLQSTDAGPRGSFFKPFPPKTKLEHRSLKVMLMETLQPITILTTSAEVTTAFRQIALCHNWLIRVPHILHHDISLNNLMLRKKAGTWLAVLTDFDLSIAVNDREEPLGPSHHERTGTLPFMATELLRGIKTLHVRRHDLEALYWSFVWLTVRYHDGKCLQPTTRTEGTDEKGKPNTVTVPAPLDKWMMASTADLHSYKREWLTDAVRCTKNFSGLIQTWHRPLRKLIHSGAWEANEYVEEFELYEESLQMWKELKAKWTPGSSVLPPEPIKPTYDAATQNGVFTWEAFEKCLKA